MTTTTRPARRRRALDARVILRNTDGVMTLRASRMLVAALLALFVSVFAVELIETASGHDQAAHTDCDHAACVVCALQATPSTAPLEPTVATSPAEWCARRDTSLADRHPASPLRAERARAPPISA